jgi:major membrane immunogen (membrane-anchored lipoprotein)
MSRFYTYSGGTYSGGTYSHHLAASNQHNPNNVLEICIEHGGIYQPVQEHNREAPLKQSKNT